MKSKKSQNLNDKNRLQRKTKKIESQKKRKKQNIMKAYFKIMIAVESVVVIVAVYWAFIAN